MRRHRRSTTVVAVLIMVVAMAAAYFPNSEDLRPDEMGVIACGTVMPTARSEQIVTSFEERILDKLKLRLQPGDLDGQTADPDALEGEQRAMARWDRGAVCREG